MSDARLNQLGSCSLCGGGEFSIKENKHWTGMRYIVLSVELVHWCEKEKFRNRVHIIGESAEEVIHQWNTKVAKTELLN